jgi:hypothetical protein
MRGRGRGGGNEGEVWCREMDSGGLAVIHPASAVDLHLAFLDLRTKNAPTGAVRKFRYVSVCGL